MLAESGAERRESLIGSSLDPTEIYGRPRYVTQIVPGHATARQRGQQDVVYLLYYTKRHIDRTTGSDDVLSLHMAS